MENLPFSLENASRSKISVGISRGHYSCKILTLNLLTTTIVEPLSNASKWQMGFNSAFKGLIFMYNAFRISNFVTLGDLMYSQKRKQGLLSCGMQSHVI